MARLVMKFGGTSVADMDGSRNVARHVKREVDAGHEVAVVVSAMAGTTNELVAWAREAAPLHDAREYDAVVASHRAGTTNAVVAGAREAAPVHDAREDAAVVASGEQVPAGLLAIILE